MNVARMKRSEIRACASDPALRFAPCGLRPEMPRHGIMSLQIVTLTERPDSRAAIFADAMQGSLWPEFMRHDPVADLYFAREVLERYLDFVLVGLEGDRSEEHTSEPQSRLHI